MVREELIRSALAPVAAKVTGAARYAAERSWWYLTGNAPERLRKPKARVRVSTDPMNDATAHAIRDVFATSGVLADLTDATVGPRIVLYEVRKHAGQSVEKILKLQREFEYAVGSPAVRLMSPIPGKQRIGIEVPRASFAPITIASLADAFAKAAPHPLLAAIGKDIKNQSIITNLAEMPHLLIAGTTGSGKSACINAILVSIISRATPAQVRMTLIDPKRVEFMPYDGLPHLRMPIVTDARKAVPALEWVVEEMDRRYSLLEKARVRDIDTYNLTADEPIPYDLVVIDELADLMMVAEAEIEDLIVRIAQKARACGIHLVLATQRPVVKVVTGLIKANVPSRLAFAVSAGVDSDTILDRRGAEKLLGKGDGLFLPMGATFPVRIQGPLVLDSEIQAAVQAAKDGTAQTAMVNLVETKPEDDPLLARAIALVITEQKGSTSLLQRRLNLGHDRASALIAAMEGRGIVGPAIKGKARAVLAQKEES